MPFSRGNFRLISALSIHKVRLFLAAHVGPTRSVPALESARLVTLVHEGHEEAQSWGDDRGVLGERPRQDSNFYILALYPCTMPFGYACLRLFTVFKIIYLACFPTTYQPYGIKVKIPGSDAWAEGHGSLLELSGVVVAPTPENELSE